MIQENSTQEMLNFLDSLKLIHTKISTLRYDKKNNKIYHNKNAIGKQ